MENFRIESLEINKIGAFEHIKMDFPKKTDPDKAEIHILTGENGTGKSTILECLVESIILYSEQKYLSFHKKSRNTESQFKVKFEHQTPYTKIFLGRLFAPTTSIPEFLIRHNDTIQKDNLDSYIQINPFDTAFFAYSGYRRVTEIKITGPKELKDNPLKEVLNFNESINPENLIQWIVNTITRELNAKGRGDFEKAKLFKESLKLLENIIFEIIDKKIVFDVNDDFDVLVIIDEFYLHFDVLPDGLKSMISWIGDLLMRMDRIKWKDDTPIFDRNFILFLDEIEVHLHPAWQRKILPVVQKLFKNAQIFISTHSPFVVGSVDGAWVHKLKKEGAYAVLDGEPILSEDAESYDTILEEVFGIKERFGDEIESKLVDFRKYTREILSGDESNFHKWEETIEFFKNQRRPDEIMSLISPQIRQINRILKQVPV